MAGTVIGRGDFAGGVTTKVRVSSEEAAGMATISGYEPNDGSLIPENVVAQWGAAGSAAAAQEQTPFAFVADAETTLYAIDAVEGSHNLMAVGAGGAWTDTGADIATLPVESTPARLEHQIIYPTKGATPQLVVFEPGSPTTKVRPLSLKGPLDYDDDEKVTVTRTTTARNSRLFRIGTGAGESSWELRAGANSLYAGVGAVEADHQRVEIHEETSADTLYFVMEFGTPFEHIDDYTYLVLDLSAKGAPLNTVETGSFENSDQTSAGSGLELVLYTAAYHDSDDHMREQHRYRTLQLPAISPDGEINRFCFHLGTSDGATTITGMGLRTRTLYLPPTFSDDAADNIFYLHWHSAAWATDWKYKGNILLPEATNTGSPWYEKLPPTPGHVEAEASGDEPTCVSLLVQFDDGLSTDHDVEVWPFPYVMYRYCYSARDLLGQNAWTYMVSNPCEENDDDEYPDYFSDPWEVYTIGVPLDCAQFLADYGSYAQEVLLYRTVRDGDTATWGDWAYIAALTAATGTLSYQDGGDDEDPVEDGNGNEVPAVLELANDFASSARYVVRCKQRVWAGGLDWDNTNHVWDRPTAIQVSSEGKPWAFPTTVDDTSLVTDGTELDGYTEKGSELRGLLARNGEVYAFLDNEFGVWRGDSPLGSGYQWTRLDSIGCVSNRTLADCRSALIWHSGFHFYAYTGAGAQPISLHRIDSTRIDFTKAHNAVFWREKYIFACTYDDAATLMIYDLTTGAWRVRSAASYDVVGICTDGDAGAVLGVSDVAGNQGQVVSLFGSTTTDYSASSTVRAWSTAEWQLVSPGTDVKITHLCFEILTTASTPFSISVTANAKGKKNGTTTKSFLVSSAARYYEVGCDLFGDAVQLTFSYTGTAAPTFQFVGVRIDEAAGR